MKLENIDLSDIEFWAKPWNERNDAFATLRRENPIAYFPEPIIDPTTIAVSVGRLTFSLA